MRGSRVGVWSVVLLLLSAILFAQDIPPSTAFSVAADHDGLHTQSYRFYLDGILAGEQPQTALVDGVIVFRVADGVAEGAHTAQISAVGTAETRSPILTFRAVAPPPPPPDVPPPPPPPDPAPSAPSMPRLVVSAPPAPDPDLPATGRRLTSADLVRVGSIRVPANVRANGQNDTGFEYGGGAISWTPTNTLLMAGHVYNHYIGELQIPAVGGTATLIGALMPLSGSVGNGTTRLAGTLVVGSTLFYSKFLFYDADHAQVASHFTRPWPGSGGVTGPIRIGALGAGFYSGYMGHIPQAWRAALGGSVLAGNCCLSIISRTSFGPAVFAITPDRLGTALPLVYYDEQHPTLGRWGQDGTINPVFNGTTKITGVVFPEGTASVLFVGMTGIGPFCYGDAAPCGDPSNGWKGDHAYPYRAYVWAYDAHDFVSVRAGQKQPWSITPYATWELPLGDVVADGGIGGVAYDAAHQRLYVSEKNADGERPLLWAFDIR